MRLSTKSLLVGILALTVCMLNAQTTLAQSKFSMSVSLAPGFASRVYNQDPNLIIKNPAIQSAFQAGTLIHYHFSNQWSVSSGMFMEWSRISEKYYLLTSPASTYYHNFLWPVLLNYQTSTRRLSPYFSTGSLLVKNKYIRSLRNPATGPRVELGYIPYKPLQMRFLLGAGFKYQLNDHLSLITQPVFTYGKLMEDSGNQYQWTLQSQLVCRF